MVTVKYPTQRFPYTKEQSLWLYQIQKVLREEYLIQIPSAEFVEEYYFQDMPAEDAAQQYATACKPHPLID